MPEKILDIRKEMKKRVVLEDSPNKEDFSEMKLNTILRHFNMSMFDYDIQKDIVYIRKQEMLLRDFTDYWFQDSGEYYYLENASGQLEKLIRKSLVQAVEEELEKIRCNTSGEILSFDTAVIYKKGNTRWVNVVANTLLEESGKPAWVMGYCRDVQKEIKEYARLEKIAQTDRLTGFRDRSSGMRKIREQLSENRDITCYIAVVDLNKFKEANDLFGHTFGDMILKEVSECMQAASEPGTILCRTGGDEFLLFGRCQDGAFAQRLMTALNGKISHQVTYRNVQFQVGASIGVSIYPLHGTSVEELYDKADMAMYYAKQNGLKEAALYDGGMDAINLGRK